MKRTLSLLLTLVMIIGIFTSVPVTVNAADVNNLTFGLNEDGESCSVIGCDEYAEGELVIPDTYNGLSVTNIGNSAFRYCANLTAITIPDSVTSIGSVAFYNCKSLTSITIPDSVTNIGDSAFSYCNSLTSITIPDSVTSIGNGTFYYCKSLTSVTIPDSVTSIGGSAFYYCKSLTSITIPDSVTSIGDSAFYYCKSLTSITIPDSVTSIGKCAFCDCTSLAAINVSSDNQYYTSVDGILFNKDQTKLIQYPYGKTATVYTIPDSVTSIGDYAFRDRSSLTSVTVPDSVTSIGDYAFYSCYNLKYIFYSGTEADRKNIVVGSDNGVLKKAVWHYEATGHTPSDWITDTEATLYAAGSKHKECTVCGDVLETETIAQLKPATPKLTSVTASAKGVTVKWGAVEGADNYNVYRKTYNAKTKKWSGWSRIKTGTTSTSYTDTAAKSGTYYRYTVIANNEAGSSKYDATGLKIYFLSTPKLTSIANNTGKVTVKWNKVSGATGYIVYRRTYNASTKTWGGWSRLATTKSNTYNDTKAKSGVYYRYTVRAYYGDYTSYFHTTGLQTKFLATPTLKTVASTKAGVKVTWGKVAGSSGYYIYRKTYSGGEWTGWKRVGKVSGGSKVSYLDESTKPDVYYKYTVRAYSGNYASWYNGTGIKIKAKY